MLTIRNLIGGARRAALAAPLFAAMLLTACGADTSSSSSGAATATATATPAPTLTATPGPASIQATLTGDSSVSGALVVGNVHFVTCDSPSLAGESILAYESAATDSTIGVLLTIRAGAIEVRVAKGSGTAYTDRTFDGSGVTDFNPAAGARFSSPLTESTPATANKGTLGAISSIAGSVSCGTFTPGSATVTVSGDTAGGTMSGGLTSVRVLCGSNTAGGFVTVSGLGHVGSTPVVVSVIGGIGGSAFYVVVQTATTAYQFSSTTPGIVTRTSDGATYSGTAKETAASPGSAGRSVTVAGSATCGTAATG